MLSGLRLYSPVLWFLDMASNSDERELNDERSPSLGHGGLGHLCESRLFNGYTQGA